MAGSCTESGAVELVGSGSGSRTGPGADGERASAPLIGAVRGPNGNELLGVPWKSQDRPISPDVSSWSDPER